MNYYHIQNSRDATHKVGARAEAAAQAYLEKQGFEVQKATQTQDLRGIDLWITRNGKTSSVQVKGQNTPLEKLVYYWTDIPKRCWGSQHVPLELDGGNKTNNKSCYESPDVADYTAHVWLHINDDHDKYKRFIINNYRFEKCVFTCVKRAHKKRFFEHRDENDWACNFYNGQYYMGAAQYDSPFLIGLYIPAKKHIEAQTRFLKDQLSLGKNCVTHPEHNTVLTEAF